MTAIAAAVPYGIAGLGQHFAQIVDETAANGELECYYASAIKQDDPFGRLVDISITKWLFPYTPLRFSQAWQTYLGGELFARAVAARLQRSNVFHTFSFHSLPILQQARSLGCKQLLLESASVHVNQVRSQQAKAFRASGMAQGWANGALQRRTIREYDLADAIFVTSQLTRDSFLREGIPQEKLRLRTLQVHPRFRPGNRRPDDDVFRVVCVGSLSVLKGTTVLLDAFARLQGQKVELTLVGGWGTRTMRRFVQAHLRRDARIRVVPGDPLPHLQRADVCVHPSFTDGFGYAPMEALACGVPVIVTEDTGMKDHVRECENGYVVPTGSWEAILERLEALRQHPVSVSNQ